MFWLFRTWGYVSRSSCDTSHAQSTEQELLGLRVSAQIALIQHGVTEAGGGLCAESLRGFISRP